MTGDKLTRKHRSEADYIDRTIATVRNHRDADNCIVMARVARAAPVATDDTGKEPT